MNMRLLIVVLITCQAWHLDGQTCIGYVQAAQDIICVEQIVDLSNGKRLNDLSQEVVRRSEIAFYQKYFNHSTLAEYKSLFLPEDWFNLTEERYLEWQKYAAEHPKTITGSIVFWHRNKRWACIQYYTTEKGMYARSALLLKYRDQQLYPASREDEAALKSITAFLKGVSTAFLSYVFSGTEISDQETRKQFDTLSGMVLSGNTIVLSKLQELIRTQNAYAVFDRALYDPSQRINPEADYARDRLHDDALRNYMDSLSISPSDQEAVFDLVKSFDYLKAGLQITSYTKDTVNFVPHVNAIRRIYGEDRIFKAQ